MESERQVGKDKILGSVSPSAPNQVMGRAIANIARHCLHPEQIEKLCIWVENRNSWQNQTALILIEMQTDFWQCNSAVPNLCCIAGAFCCLPSPSLPPYPSSHPSIIALRTHSAMCSFLLVFVHVFFCVPPVLVVLLHACALLVLLHYLYLCALPTWAWLTHISPLLTSNWPHNHHPPPPLLLASSTAAAQKLDPNLLSFWQSQSCAINPQSSRWRWRMSSELVKDRTVTHWVESPTLVMRSHSIVATEWLGKVKSVHMR